MSTQINKVFGETLEFSCTVGEGRIISQELVTSGPDAFVSFKLDKDNFLDAHELEDIARQIRAALTGGKISLASPEQTSNAISKAKAFVSACPAFADNSTSASFAIAEYELNKVGLTMYANCVVDREEQVAAPKTWGMATTAVAAGYGSYNDGDDWDDDDTWDEDDEDDYCACGCMDHDDDEDFEDDEDDIEDEDFEDEDDDEDEMPF